MVIINFFVLHHSFPFQRFQWMCEVVNFELSLSAERGCVDVYKNITQLTDRNYQ